MMMNSLVSQLQLKSTTLVLGGLKLQGLQESFLTLIAQSVTVSNGQHVRTQHHIHPVDSMATGTVDIRNIKQPAQCLGHHE